MTASHYAPDTLLGRYEWHARAACRGDAKIFFGAGGLVDIARRVCGSCPVRQQCLDQAMRLESGLAHDFRFGVWGGLDPKQRARLDPDVRARSEKRKNVPRYGGKPLAPCGTRGAYERHKRKREPVDDACQAAYDEYLAARSTRASRKAAA
ncbi:WhiB family transcriptional regulator [Streptomyces sp. E11-3]|uniref:WhiB family transcriptional regulator n=1 Tax=Streptomyces sp. E11-3 TaxID=3110112 RepID=UPI00397F344F